MLHTNLSSDNIATTNTMASSNPLPEVIIFTFPESVFGLRLQRYLNLRSIPFTSLRVPPNMPRPVLKGLGINYRRIPVLSLGRDIYIDTRLILRKLETLFHNQSQPLGASDPFNRGIEAMLEEFIISGGPFWRMAGCIPVSSPLVQSDVWMKDRFDGSGGQFSREALQNNRAWSISQVRCYFAMVEEMLKDGRTWLLNTSDPSMAELHAGWLYEWAIHIGDSLQQSPEQTQAAVGDMTRALSQQEFPHVHAWIKRFRKACDAAARRNPCQGNEDMLEGRDAEEDIMKRILSASSTTDKHATTSVEEGEVLGLQKGVEVTVAPTDFGFTHRDRGVLVGLTRDEAVIEVNVPKENPVTAAVGGATPGTLRLHYPRVGFKILPVADTGVDKEAARI